MANPFQLRWLQGWKFQLVLMDGNVLIEAYGYGISLRTSLKQGEEPSTAADRLVLEENVRRKQLHNSWIRSQNVPNIIKEKEHRVDNNKKDPLFAQL